MIFTKAALVWQQVGMKVADLQIHEGLEDDRQSLCTAYSLPYLLYKTSEDGSSFNNLDTASKQVYREKIIPDWTSIESAFNKHFKLAEKGEKLVFDYSHIDVLQDDEKKTNEANTVKSDGINSILLEYNKGTLSFDQAKFQLIEVWNINEDNATTLLIKPDIQIQNETEIQNETT